MKIRITPLAERKLRERLGILPGTFKLLYDTGHACGCDGINVLLILDKPDIGDLHVEAGGLPFVVNTQHEIFYEEQLKLDADEHMTSFVLTSDSQLYGKNIQLRDLRGLELSEYHSHSSCEILPRSN
ncbi:iron-sulfur cluster biosynthesis family protein [Paenibacillus sp. HN-1]|uniref:iron-sulfur cluster biosynthesis family protein n=1 Tax=Paenibacillus TaxID=44249 RepID=UPI001CA9D247|nr:MULTISPECIES: iron-sulfur cluster biosynthesis family protein [Paenibacillus]MBY9081847.1 iron-sulfur cluster biosynthesis family protein [Paenibacillus sp. CGMCC 1.18879]MBY9085995.1 iron-sulfur cluster biosynthesis family protein [Paenibacillus sinensis]